MLKEAQLFFLMLALFLPTQQQFIADGEEEEEDGCVLKASLVLHEIKSSCRKANSNDANNRDAPCSKMVSEIEEIKSVNTQILEKLEKIEKKLGKVDVNALGEAQTDTKPTVESTDCKNGPTGKNSVKENIFSAFGTKFHFNSRKMSWREAKEYCKQQNMQLAMLKTENQMASVSHQLKNKGFDGMGFWVSASDIDRTAGAFQWADGMSLDKNTWQSAFPSRFGFGKETCVYLYTGSNKFFDETCSVAFSAVCEECK